MTHLPFIAGAYALGVVIPAGFALAAYLRLGAARRRLAVIDPRGRAGASPRARPGASPGAGSGEGTSARGGVTS